MTYFPEPELSWPCLWLQGVPVQPGLQPSDHLPPAPWLPLLLLPWQPLQLHPVPPTPVQLPVQHASSDTQHRQKVIFIWIMFASHSRILELAIQNFKDFA